MAGHTHAPKPIEIVTPALRTLQITGASAGGAICARGIGTFRRGHVNGHHQRLHVARRLLVVQGVHDVTGDMIVAGNQVDVTLGDDVRGDRPVPKC